MYKKICYWPLAYFESISGNVMILIQNHNIFKSFDANVQLIYSQSWSQITLDKLFSHYDPQRIVIE